MAQQEPTAPFEGSEQNLVFALNEKWDTNTLAWIKDTGTGGGGGAVTIADGADVAQGSVADAAWVSGDGTVISLLKTIASPSGGGLTDAQLRATPVPISGALTDTELRATPVPVSGTVTANTGLSQPLTDAQLRATPVPIDLAGVSSGVVPMSLDDYNISSLPVHTYGMRALRLDEASSTVTYVGTAAAGTPTASASWAIFKMDTTSGIVITWADGDSLSNNIWDNRAVLAYS